MKNSFFTLILLINLSCFILSCGDKETGGGGTGGGGGSSVTSSASLLSGAYSIDPNGSGRTLLPPQDDPQGIEDPGMPANFRYADKGPKPILEPLEETSERRLAAVREKPN